MTHSLSSHIVRYIIYLLIQVLLLKDLVLFDRAFIFVYIISIILLPVEIGPLLLIVIGFIGGLTVDIFYNTQGIQASACVLIMFLKPYFFQLVSGSRYESGTNLNLREMGLSWFFVFCFPLIFIHHLTVFFTEASSTAFFWFTFSKALFSSIFTFVVALIFQYLFTKSRRRL